MKRANAKTQRRREKGGAVGAAERRGRHCAGDRRNERICSFHAPRGMPVPALCAALTLRRCSPRASGLLILLAALLGRSHWRAAAGPTRLRPPRLPPRRPLRRSRRSRRRLRRPQCQPLTPVVAAPAAVITEPTPTPPPTPLPATPATCWHRVAPSTATATMPPPGPCSTRSCSTRGRSRPCSPKRASTSAAPIWQTACTGRRWPPSTGWPRKSRPQMTRTGSARKRSSSAPRPSWGWAATPMPSPPTGCFSMPTRGWARRCSRALRAPISPSAIRRAPPRPTAVPWKWRATALPRLACWKARPRHIWPPAIRPRRPRPTTLSWVSPRMPATAPRHCIRPARRLLQPETCRRPPSAGSPPRWSSRRVNSAYLALVELVNRNVDFDLFQRGYIDVQAEAYEPAVYALETYLAAVDPTDARAGQALHLLGQAYAGLGNLAAAVDALRPRAGDLPRLRLLRSDLARPGCRACRPGRRGGRPPELPHLRARAQGRSAGAGGPVAQRALWPWAKATSWRRGWIC